MTMNNVSQEGMMLFKNKRKLGIEPLLFVSNRGFCFFSYVGVSLRTVGIQRFHIYPKFFLQTRIHDDEKFIFVLSEGTGTDRTAIDGHQLGDRALPRNYDIIVFAVAERHSQGRSHDRELLKPSLFCNHRKFPSNDVYYCCQRSKY